ncbi:unnamed protein product [Calypogeia fissa]
MELEKRLRRGLRQLGHGIRGIVVEEDSARHGMGGCYSSIRADHNKICKPEDKSDIGFQRLAGFLRGILQQSNTTQDGASG